MQNIYNDCNLDSNYELYLKKIKYFEYFNEKKTALAVHNTKK